MTGSVAGCIYDDRKARAVVWRLEPCHVQSEGGSLSGRILGLTFPAPCFSVPLPVPPVTHNIGPSSVESDRHQLLNPDLNSALLVVITSLRPLSNVAHDEGSDEGPAADGVSPPWNSSAHADSSVFTDVVVN